MHAVKIINLYIQVSSQLFLNFPLFKTNKEMENAERISAKKKTGYKVPFLKIYKKSAFYLLQSVPVR